MKNKRWQNMLILVLTCVILGGMLAVGGVSLAQYGDGTGDKFLGFQLAYEDIEMGAGHISNAENWTDYGTRELKLEGLGTVSTDRKIIVGTWDEGHQTYIFPGVKGYNCFVVEEDGYTRGYYDLIDRHLTVGINSYQLEGTVYFGTEFEGDERIPGDNQYVWTPYRVYQMEDGTVYMEVSGLHSYGPQGGFTVTEKEEFTTRVNGRKTTESMEVSFSIQWIERIAEIEVKQFDEYDRVLTTEHFSTADMEASFEGKLHPKAAWVLVQEITADKTGKKTVYTMDDRTDDGAIHHRLILLDREGMGFASKLTLR